MAKSEAWKPTYSAASLFTGMPLLTAITTKLASQPAAISRMPVRSGRAFTVFSTSQTATMPKMISIGRIDV